MARNSILNETEFWANDRDLETSVEKLTSGNQAMAHDGARWFMSAIYDAGRTLELHPEWAAQPAWRDFIKKSAPILAKRILEFSRIYQEPRIRFSANQAPTAAPIASRIAIAAFVVSHPWRVTYSRQARLITRHDSCPLVRCVTSRAYERGEESFPVHIDGDERAGPCGRA